MSKSMNIRPSQVLDLDDPFEVYALDSAVVRWGTSFEAAIADAVNGAKDGNAAEKAQQRVIRRWIPSTRQYADPRQRDQKL
jgi:hypothetical protein